MKILKIVAINLVVLAILAVVVEAGSWGVLKAYYRFFFSRPSGIASDHFEVERQDIFTTPELRRAYTEWNQSPFRYMPFAMYMHKPLQSGVMDIREDGSRSNGTESDARKCGYTIWMFGSSSLVAPEVLDDETLAARLEAKLNEGASGSSPSICVKNFGQVGYVVQQDLALFNNLLGLNTAPNMIVTFDGWNDMNISWAYKPVEERYDSWFEPVFDQWFVNGPAVIQRVKEWFPNTIALIQKASDFIGLHMADPAQFKAAYLERQRRFNRELDEEKYPERQRVVFETLKSIVGVAKIRGIDVVLTQIPVMMAADKTWVGFEKSYWNARALNSFARPEAEIEAWTGIDRFAFQQYERDWQMIDPALFRRWYRENNQKLKRLADGTGSGYVDMTAVLDAPRYRDEVLYLSQAHMSKRGLDILATALAREVRGRMASSSHRPATATP